MGKNTSINNISHLRKNSLIPKLDFSKVQEKYNNENMKKISILNNSKVTKPNVKRDKDDIFEIENEKLKKKVEKYKKGYNEIKERYNNIKIKFKIISGKVEILETQIKRMTNRQSTEDITNKRFEIAENTSMVRYHILRMKNLFL